MSKYTAFRCPENILQAVKARAKADRRSLSNYLVTLLAREVGMEPSVEPEAPAANPTAKPRFGKKAKR